MICDLPDALHADALALWEQTGLTRPWNDPARDLQRALAGPASTVLAEVVEGRLLGTAMVGVDGHRGWMYYLAVAPAASRTGVGRRLVAACEDWVLARDVPKLMLMVRTSNAGVLGFYAALGYDVAEVATLGKLLAPAS